MYGLFKCDVCVRSWPNEYRHKKSYAHRMKMGGLRPISLKDSARPQPVPQLEGKARAKPPAMTQRSEPRQAPQQTPSKSAKHTMTIEALRAARR